MNEKRNALLLSGGVDSTALANWLKPSVAITIDYGQVCAAAEIEASRKVCDELKLRHQVVEVDCSSLGSGDLCGTPPIPLAPETDWWPFRNQLLITIAAMALANSGVEKLSIGTVSSDSFHADGAPKFIKMLSELLAYQEGGITVDAPAINLTSVELVRKSEIDRGLLAWSHSCHTANFACGRCRGCNKHREVFEALGYGAY